MHLEHAVRLQNKQPILQFDLIAPCAMRSSAAPQQTHPHCLQNLGFDMGPPASLTYANVTWCEGASEPPAAQLQPPDVPHKLLFVLAAEQTGAAALVDALGKHPAFVLGRQPDRRAVSFCGLLPLTHCCCCLERPQLAACRRRWPRTLSACFGSGTRVRFGVCAHLCQGDAWHAPRRCSMRSDAVP
jgi:hypothetical protein